MGGTIAPLTFTIPAGLLEFQLIVQGITWGRAKTFTPGSMDLQIAWETEQGKRHPYISIFESETITFKVPIRTIYFKSTSGGAITFDGSSEAFIRPKIGPVSINAFGDLADDNYSLAVSTKQNIQGFGVTDGSSQFFPTFSKVGAILTVGNPTIGFAGTGVASIQSQVQNSAGTQLIPLPIYDLVTNKWIMSGQVTAAISLHQFWVPCAGLINVGYAWVKGTSPFLMEGTVAFTDSNENVPLPQTSLVTPTASPILTARFNGNPGAVDTVVIAAVVGKTIVVTGWSLSTDTAMLLRLHHQAAASNTNQFAGGYFPANGGEAKFDAYGLPGLAVNQPVSVLPAVAGNIEVVVSYYLL